MRLCSKSWRVTATRTERLGSIDKLGVGHAGRMFGCGLPVINQAAVLRVRIQSGQAEPRAIHKDTRRYYRACVK